MRVAVIGAGIAGLYAARLLAKEHVESVVFEADDRAGGRLRTERIAGLPVEAGGEWIDADHHRARSLLTELDFDLIASEGYGPRYFCADGEELDAADCREALGRLDSAARPLCSGLSEVPWQNEGCEDLDRRSLAILLKQAIPDERQRAYATAVCRSDEGEEPENISLLAWLCSYAQAGLEGTDGTSAFRLAGLWEEVIERLAHGNRLELRMGCEVRAVESGSSVSIDSERGTEQFDAAIVALPPQALRKLRISPELSNAKRTALASPMGRALKASLVFKDAWWHGEGWTGSGFFEGPLQQTWASGSGPVLSAYICGEAASCLRGAGRPLDLLVEQLSAIFPVAREELVTGTLHDWMGIPWLGGGFSVQAPGFALGGMRELSRPEGCLAFAGEHTAARTGFIESALESAERAVSEVLA